MSPKKPTASLSLDLDNLWSYLKTHGDPSWREFPSYLQQLVPTTLDFLEARKLRITFFVVGRDAAFSENRDVLRAIKEAGHEIANHSFHHDPWLHLYPDEQIDEEVQRSTEAIQEATGVRPSGFRGPGYSVSEATLNSLRHHGYSYDATTLPTWVGPLARAYFFRTAQLTPQEREERAALFGSWRDAARSNSPYAWTLNGGKLTEVPVTTVPFVRLPFHISYLQYIAQVSARASRAYFQTALRLCLAARVGPSVLMHPPDLFGADDVDGLGFFPGMRQQGSAKRSRLSDYLELLTDRFQIRTVGEHAATLDGLGAKPPKFW